jgi:hypothetical protein
MTEVKRGWKRPSDARKWHYFNAEFTSLCGKWMVFSLDHLDNVSHFDKENCVECKKLREKLEE